MNLRIKEQKQTQNQLKNIKEFFRIQDLLQMEFVKNFKIFSSLLSKIKKILMKKLITLQIGVILKWVQSRKKAKEKYWKYLLNT